MSAETVHDMLHNEIASLPESLAQEALDFILFMKIRHAEEEFLWARVQEARSHRKAHPEDLITATADEWEQLTADADSER